MSDSEFEFNRAFELHEENEITFKVEVHLIPNSQDIYYFDDIEIAKKVCELLSYSSNVSHCTLE